MDRYVLAKLRQYVADMTRQLDDYEVANACDSTRTFLEVLTNWYVRRSRDRFWGESTEAFERFAEPALEEVDLASTPELHVAWVDGVDVRPFQASQESRRQDTRHAVLV